MRRRTAYLVLAAAAALPRLAALLHERSTITSAYVDKGDDFARTFLAHGTYGFIPGHPSAYTQPLYGFFLIPLYWFFSRSWIVVGLAQIAVAVATAWVVWEIGRRWLPPRIALAGAVLATLHPYLIWHDVHMNREILDELLAAVVVLLTLVVAERPRLATGAALGGALGLAILGNVRLALLPLLVVAFVLWRRGRTAAVPAAAALACCGIVLAPWLIRNEVQLGCFVITTDARALWKANNTQTLSVLRHGKWIDDVKPIPGTPPSPQDAGSLYEQTGRVEKTDECAQMRFYRHRVWEFWRHHPGTKAQLAVQGAKMLWQPTVTKTEGRPNKGSWIDTARTWVEPVYIVPLILLALLGIRRAPRAYVVLALALLAYATLTAMVFVGETRYRAPWDFLIALPAAAGLVQLYALTAPHGVRHRGKTVTDV